jgi:hypothetical protein
MPCLEAQVLHPIGCIPKTLEIHKGPDQVLPGCDFTRAGTRAHVSY